MKPITLALCLVGISSFAHATGWNTTSYRDAQGRTGSYRSTSSTSNGIYRESSVRSGYLSGNHFNNVKTERTYNQRTGDSWNTDSTGRSWGQRTTTSGTFGKPYSSKVVVDTSYHGTTRTITERYDANGNYHRDIVDSK
jgi:hypothetical protein